MGKLVHGGKVYADVVHGVAVTPDLITDVSGFTKVYSTSSDISYGSLGTRVSNALEITNANGLSAYMQGGWNESHACFYDAEGKIGAYAGYDFGEELYIGTVDFWIGKYSAQNKTLYATVQWLDSNGTWNDVTDLAISSSTGYPLNIMSVSLNRKCYGVRWVHKNGETKSSGNNIVFFGMLLYRYVELHLIRALIPKMTSNTTPSGVASASSEYNANYYAYKAFDSSMQSLWGSVDRVSAGQWIKYDFGHTQLVSATSIVIRDNSSYAVGELKFQGSLDDTNWVDIETVDNLSVGEIRFVSFGSSFRFRYYRWYIVSNVSGSSGSGTGFVELQLYGAE